VGAQAQLSDRGVPFRQGWGSSYHTPPHTPPRYPWRYPDLATISYTFEMISVLRLGHVTRKYAHDPFFMRRLTKGSFRTRARRAGHPPGGYHFNGGVSRVACPLHTPWLSLYRAAPSGFAAAPCNCPIYDGRGVVLGARLPRDQGHSLARLSLVSFR
jgi:hypothetical protein